MKKIFSTIIIIISLSITGNAQNHVVQKWVLPQMARISILQNPAGNDGDNPINISILAEKSEIGSLLIFNNRSIIHPVKRIKKGLQLITEFSFGDLMENRISGLKQDLINTYDGHISELFSDAPSLVKFKCVIII